MLDVIEVAKENNRCLGGFSFADSDPLDKLDPIRIKRPCQVASFVCGKFRLSNHPVPSCMNRLPDAAKFRTSDELRKTHVDKAPSISKGFQRFKDRQGSKVFSQGAFEARS